MKGSLEGRRVEFSTSVTLAGLSIMCDVVEPERWSESGHVGCLRAGSRVSHPWIQDRILFFWYATRSMRKLCFKFPFLQSFSHWVYKVFFFHSFYIWSKGIQRFFYDIALQLLDISLLFMS